MKTLLFCMAVASLAGPVLAKKPKPAGNANPAAPVGDVSSLRDALVRQSWTWKNQVHPDGLNIVFWRNGAISQLSGGPIIGV